MWARVIAQDTAVGANSAVFTNLLATFETEYGADLLGCTVMRIRGFFIASAGGAQDLAVAGIRTYDESSFASFGADDGPATALHSDWMYWSPMLVTSVEGLYFDVKSMRKIEELNRSLMLSISNPTATAQTWSFTASMLLALP